MSLAPAGASGPPADVKRVAELTVKALMRTVPPAVPGIMFLSGGQARASAPEPSCEAAPAAACVCACAFCRSARCFACASAAQPSDTVKAVAIGGSM